MNQEHYEQERRPDGSQGTLDGYRIRKLTPRECWRLMGFSDDDFDKAQAIKQPKGAK